MVRSSKWSGHSPFKAVMLGSSPAQITITLGYSQVAKAPVFDTGIVGSSPVGITNQLDILEFDYFDVSVFCKLSNSLFSISFIASKV